MYTEAGIYFEEDSNNLMEPITFEDDEKKCFRPLRYKDCNPTRYLINPYGDIYDKKKERLISTNSHDSGGYRQATIECSEQSKSKYTKNSRTLTLHRLVASNFCPNPNPEEYSVVNHIDADKENDYYKNLEWCTSQQNSLHAIRNGLRGNQNYNDTPSTLTEPNPHNGENNGRAKLKAEQVEKICSLMEKGDLSYGQILTECGLEANKKNLDIVTKIRSKKLWRSISYKYNIPEKESRKKAILYTDEQIHLICKMIQDGCSSKEIYTVLGVDRSTKNESDKFYKFIMRIRRRQTYTHISKDYKW